MSHSILATPHIIIVDSSSLYPPKTPVFICLIIIVSGCSNGNVLNAFDVGTNSLLSSYGAHNADI